MKEFEKWLKDKEFTWIGVPIDKDITDTVLKKGYIAGMECALRLYCEDVTDFHENILQELKELDD